MIKYFIYCRKSSEQEDRQVLSLDSQEKELKELAKKENLAVVGTYRESGSAHVIGRKCFNEMISRIENGEANGLIVWDESRIARNSLDGGKVIYMFDINQITEIHKPGKIYKNTPDDKSWLGMLFTMTKKDSDDKGVNVKRGLKAKAEKGWLPSGAKPGYMNDKYAEKGNKTIGEDPDRYPIIKECWELMLTGAYSPPKILNILNDVKGYRSPIRKSIGGKPMCRSQIYRVFTDPFYYGYFEYPERSGIWHKGQHKPMVTKEEFDRVQMLLGRNNSPRPHTHEFAFTGVIRCGECNALITAEEKWQIICTNCRTKFASLNKEACPKCNTRIEEMHKPTILHYIYYHCTKRKKPNCTQGCVNVTLLEEQVAIILSKMNISEEFKNWAIKYLNKLNEDEVVDRNATISSLQNAYNNCVARIDNLVKLKISPQNTDGSILSDDEFKTQKITLITEKANLEDRLKNNSKRIDKWLEDAEKAFDFAVHARYWFEKGTLEEKRQILLTIGSNMKLFNKIFSLDAEKPYNYIEEVVEKAPDTSAMFEPEKRSVMIALLEDSWSKNPLVLPRVDSNHEPSS